MPHRFIDLSHDIFDGLVTYKGLPPPIVCDFLSRKQSRSRYEEGTEFHIGKIEMVANTGTYLDCPFHRYENRKDFSQFDLDAFVELNAITISAENVTEVGIEFFKGKELRNKAVLVYTNWAKHWNTSTYFDNHPYLTGAAAEYLRDNQVRLVGIDSHNIDDTRGKTRTVHTVLLGADILIAEHLCNLHLLPAANYTFTAVPPKFKGVGSFPVRAYATVK